MTDKNAPLQTVDANHIALKKSDAAIQALDEVVLEVNAALGMVNNSAEPYYNSVAVHIPVPAQALDQVRTVITKAMEKHNVPDTVAVTDLYKGGTISLDVISTPPVKFGEQPENIFIRGEALLGEHKSNLLAALKEVGPEVRRIIGEVHLKTAIHVLQGVSEEVAQAKSYLGDTVAFKQKGLRELREALSKVQASMDGSISR